MKLPTALVISKKVLALPVTAANGAMAIRHRMCLTDARMLAFISCKQCSNGVHAIADGKVAE